MVKHVLKDGTELDDIRGIVVTDAKIVDVIRRMEEKRWEKEEETESE